MVRKAIATVLLLAMAVWAEMAMAPMLAMHAGHMRPGHETVADLPASHAGHHHAESTQMDERPCCPGLHKAAPEDMSELAEGTPTCDDPHSCCFRQGPQSVPALASEAQQLTGEMASSDTTTVSLTPASAGLVIDSSVLALPPPPNLYGMTLRI